MESPAAESTEPAQILFRPAKKRKIYRHRSEEDDATAVADSAAPIDAPSTSAPVQRPPTEADRDDDAPSVAEALRLRNLRKHRHGGVAFRAGPSSHGENGGTADENTERGLVLHSGTDEAQQEESAILGGINRRFAAQTGLVGELVNRHMEEYVESELARRKRHAAEISAQKQPTDDGGMIGSQSGPAPTVPGKQVESQRVLHGKLLEIDLGDEARARNVEMTERARRRLEGLAADEEDEAAGPRQKKPRLGPDGKPWRTRKRRGSEDIKRDQLVEKFLSENRLDIYDLPPEQPAAFEGLEDEEMAADDRIAEEFRREYMDAMSQRRRRKTMQPAKPGAKKEEEVLKGPKLGGSRNARAAMRDILLKEQEKKKR